jgi:hypothetical protein
MAATSRCARSHRHLRGSPATTDTINFGYLPANARIHYAVLESTDMDTNGSPTLPSTSGIRALRLRLFSASTVGQAGTLTAIRICS